MTKADLVQLVRDQFLLGGDGFERLSHDAAQHAVETVFSFMKQALAEHDYVVIRKFGVFRIQHKRERIGLNPQTGEHHVVSARTICKFKAGTTLRRLVDNGQ